VASEVAKRLQDRRQSLWADARKYVEDAATENRDMTPEEQGTWERLMEEMDKVDGQLEGVLTAEKRQSDTDKAFDAIGKRPAEYRRGGDGYAHPADSDGRDINAEIRGLIRGAQGAARSLEVKHQGGTFGMEEVRTLLSNSGTGTGVVPTDFYDRLIAYLIEVSGIMQAGPTVLNTSGGETLQIPKATAHVSGAVFGQGAQITSGDPTFAQTTLSAYKYGRTIYVARELIDDNSVDLLGYLAMQAGRAVGNAFGSDLILGAGSTVPSGLTFSTSASPGVTGPTSGAGPTGVNWVTGGPTYANLVDMEYSVIAPYRQSRSCYWMCADKTVAVLRKLTDTVGRPVWEPSTVLGSPDLLLGKPLVADPYVQSVATGNFSLFFGDFAQFFVRLVGGIRFERSDDFKFDTDLVSFRCLLRGDGTLVDTTAIKSFKGG